MLTLAKCSKRCCISLASFLLGLWPGGGRPFKGRLLATSISRSLGRVGSSVGYKGRKNIKKNKQNKK